ncbi:MAG: PqqD family protein [Clostridia bacterium]|nr:PqqD family protein [Clostridia bacterium]
MKVKDGFLLREVAGKTIVVPVGAELNFSGMITLNETGAFLWNCLTDMATEEELLAKLMAEYEIDSRTAKADIDSFLDKLKKLNILED